MYAQGVETSDRWIIWTDPADESYPKYRWRIGKLEVKYNSKSSKKR